MEDNSKVAALLSISVVMLGVLMMTSDAGSIKTIKRRSGHTMVVSSHGFTDVQRIPNRYTCEGENISPQLSWSNAPNSTQSFVVICDDPDAPSKYPWVHWVVYNIPVTQTALDSNLSKNPVLENGVMQGINSSASDNVGYRGPCPPSGHGTHHYYFKVYALNKKLNLEPGASKSDVETAMLGSVVATGELMGTYSRE